MKKLYAPTVWHELIAAVIAQSAIDYVECRAAGLILADHTINKELVSKLARNEGKVRCPMPKWMEISDIHSCVPFLFEGDTLSDFIPSCWATSPEAIRLAVKKAGDEGKSIHHFFDFVSNNTDKL